jgi:ABC-type lipoprotein release transport system permease subunit
MRRNGLWHFVAFSVVTNRAKHIPLFLIAAVMIWLLASVMMIAASIERDLKSTLAAQPDFTLQRFVAGRQLNMPVAWADEFIGIEGITDIRPRVYGTHYYDPTEEHFMIVGVDFFDESMMKHLEKVTGPIDYAAFMARPNMIIGAGVKAHFDAYHYFESYTFRPPDRSKARIYIYDTFERESALFTNDMIIMPIDLARRVLGVNEAECTDIVLNVPNADERATVKNKLIVTHFDMRIIQKEDIATYYEHLFNFKGGLFMIVYMVAFAAFLILLYFRYAAVSTDEAKDIGILRSLGWSISQVLGVKVAETAVVALGAFCAGVVAAYGYVFMLDAPLIREIFLGYGNLLNHATFTPAVDAALLISALLVYLGGFALSVLIPAWRLAIVDPWSVMK